MIKIEEIDMELIEWTSSTPINKDFVAVAVSLSPAGAAKHSGFLISYKGTLYFFHWLGGEEIDLEDTPKYKNVFFKELNFINEQEVLAFLTHCKLIQINAKPVYGFFYAGDYYDTEGKYLSKSGLGEFMTCVGFCINVVKGYIEGHEYFYHEDWNEEGVPEDFFDEFLIQVRARNHDGNIDETSCKNHMRRITPLDYTAAAYLDGFPIRKANIDKIAHLVRDVLASRVSKN